MIELAASLPTKALDSQHCEYAEHCQTWDELDLLYRGGAAIRGKQASRFLRRRPKEVADVYEHRLERFSYQNILGTALGWYQSALFEEDPAIDIKSPDEFFPAFLADCNRAGKTFVNLWREVALDLMLYRSSWVLADLPKSDEEYDSRESQRLAGALDPYLVRYDPRQVVNWECDRYGNLEWIVIATTSEERGFAQPAVLVDRWYVFDREQWGIYEARRDKDQRQKAEVAILTGAGRHSLADHGIVPVQRVEIPDALWLANRAYLQVIDHLNQDNTFAWALFMANLPVPVITGEYKNDLTVSETAVIQLPEGGDFKFTEPAGTSFEHSARRIQSLVEEIHRQMYIISQARSTTATPAAQSGISKQEDAKPGSKALNGFGDVIRAAMVKNLKMIAAIRGDEPNIGVRGFQFDEEDASGEVSTVQQVQMLQIPSDTLEKECWKNVARAVLQDASPDLIATIEGEIDAAPTQEQRAAEEERKQKELISGRLLSAGKKAA
jgi:hypothetical protein